MATRRPVISEETALRALAHPVRLDVLNHLMAEGPATASACARAVGDTPSNCSYHLRVLAQHGLVEPDASADGRERPWRATVTGFSVADPEPGSPTAAGTRAVLAASLHLDQRRVREYVVHRDDVDREWREADAFNNYGLRVTPEELTDLVAAVDALIRPYIAATRSDAPPGARTVQVGLHAFVRDGVS